MGILKFFGRIAFWRRKKAPKPRLHQITGMNLRGPKPPPLPANKRTSTTIGPAEAERIRQSAQARRKAPPATRPRVNVRPSVPPPLPGVFDVADAAEWNLVSSSWIWGLRFITDGPVGNNPRALRGYVDMKTHKSPVIYRYGPGVKFGEFGRWLEVASKGKHWWRMWTARWSPAVKI